jgi:hypothetical protein
MPNIVPATAEGLPTINRRSLLGNLTALTAASAVAGAVASTAATYEPAGPAMTRREKAIWHLRELERLAVEDGGSGIVVQLVAVYDGPRDCKLLGIHYTGRLMDRDGMFAEGGAA